MTQNFERSLTLAASPAEVFAWHSRLAAFDRLVPPWQAIEIIERPDGLLEDSRLSFRIRQGPISLVWVARHENVFEGCQFVDVQEKGPFSYWRHEHRFEEISGGGCRLRDRIEYRLPLGFLGAAVAGWKIRADLEAMFAYRHFTTLHDLELHGRWRRHLCLGVVARPGHRLARTVWALLSTGGHHVEELEPGETPPEWWDSLDAVVDLEPEGRPERLERWRGNLMLTVGGEMPQTRWSRHVHLRPAELLGARARACDFLPPAFSICQQPGNWVSLDDAAAAIVFAIQTPEVAGDIEVRAGQTPELESQGFSFRHLDYAETRARYGGQIRLAFDESESGSGASVAVMGGS